MLTQLEKAEIRGMRDHMQVLLHNECKEYLRTGYATVDNGTTVKRVKLNTQAMLKLDDMREFLQSIFAARALIQYKRQYN
jgi:hypothetical protein